MRRNPTVSVRIPERVSKARARVTKPTVLNWFNVLKETLEEMGCFDILSDPSRVFNCDETNIQLCPDTGKVVGIKGWRNIYEVGPGPEKSTLTFVGTFNAAGDIVTPTLIYPYLRIPKDIVFNVPEHFFVSNTDSGWMTSPAFFEFVANAFHPWLIKNKIKLPVIFFVDGHKTHQTLQLAQFCEDHQIILYLLPPNTTHLLQPADVSAFKPLKSYWKTEVHEFQRLNPNEVVRRRNVGRLLDNVLKKISRQTIINGFKKCGLCPYNPEAPDYSKLLDITVEGEDPNLEDQQDSNIKENEYINALRVFKLMIGEAELKKIDNEENVTLSLKDYYNMLKRKCIANDNHNTDVTIPEEMNNNVITMDQTNQEIVISDENTMIISNILNIDINSLPEVTTLHLENDLTNSVANTRSNPPASSNPSFSPERAATPPVIREPINLTNITQPPPLLSDDTLPFINSPEIDDPGELPAPLLRQNAFKANVVTSKDTPLDSAAPLNNNPNNPPLDSISSKPSTSGTQNDKNLLSNHVFWDGKLNFKKRKTPTEPTPSLLSPKILKALIEQKEAEKAMKKRSANDWRCFYCTLYWSDDKQEYKKSKSNAQWIGCDTCTRKMHVSCIPKKFIATSKLDISKIGEDIPFKCEKCC